MPTVNLELQMKFLDDLEMALADALRRYGDEDEEKLSELKYMRQEVDRARRIVSRRIEEDDRASLVSDTGGYVPVAAQ